MSKRRDGWVGGELGVGREEDDESEEDDDEKNE